MRDKRIGSIAKAPYPRLEAAEGECILYGGLDEVLTGSKSKAETVAKLRRNMHIKEDHPSLKSLQKEKLDVALVIYTQKSNYRIQDVDNLAKVVLDALKKPRIDDGKPNFFDNDSQIVRLLIWKRERIEDPENNTCQIAFSMRKHDPKKEMILVCGTYNNDRECFEIIPFSQFEEGSVAVF